MFKKIATLFRKEAPKRHESAPPREAPRRHESPIEPLPPPKRHESPIVVRTDRDTLRPGSVVVQHDLSYRVTKLLMVNKLGAFYEAKAE